MTVRLLMAARVTSESWPSESVRELRLQPVHRPQFPQSAPGDHVQLQHRNGTRRDYSLIGDPDDCSTYTVAIARQADGRGGSRLFHDDVAVGDQVFVSYPQPGMQLTRAAHHIFIVGGIGITAVITLIDAVPAGQSAELHACVRSIDSAAYARRDWGPNVVVKVHESSSDGRMDIAALLQHARPDTALYHCGPPSLMEAVAHASAHWPSGTVHSEAFSGVTALDELQGESFDAWLVLSKRAIRVGTHESLLQAMLREQVPLEYSCEGGVCGSCVVEVIDGRVEHRDRCLDDSERSAAMTACVSRGRGSISIQA